MEIVNIVIFVFILLVIIYALVNVFSKTSQLTTMAEGKIMQTIEAKELKNSKNSSNYTYSMWMFIDDWNYRFGEKKIVLARENSPTVVLGTKPNTLTVKVSYFKTEMAGAVGLNGSGGTTAPVYDLSDFEKNKKNRDACNAKHNGYAKCVGNDCDEGLFKATEAGKPQSYESTSGVAGTAGSTSTTKPAAGASSATPWSDKPDEPNVSTCEIDNIPIQNWVNVIVSLYNRTLDIYLNGKLVRTCVLPGVPDVNNDAPVFVTPGGGFSGWTSTFKYWANASNPQEAYNIYKDGFGGSILANLINKYKLRVSLMKGQDVTSSFEI